MAEFEELRLTVNLADNASAGLAGIRAKIADLTQSMAGLTTGATAASTAITGVGSASASVAPRIHAVHNETESLSKSSLALGRSLTEVARAALAGGLGFPVLASSMKEAALGVGSMATGVMSLTAGLGALGPVAATATVAIGALAIGIVAFGAAVVGYGVMVFKFAREMAQLSTTAKAMGSTFAELKNARDYADRFGESIEQVTQNLSGLQRAQTDLAQNNSGLANSLIAKGLDPKFLRQYAQVQEFSDAQNMLQAKGIAIRDALMKDKGWNKRAAEGYVTQNLLQPLGGDAGMFNRAPMPRITPQEKQELERIDKLSEQVDLTWRSIATTFSQLKTETLASRLPFVLDVLKQIKAAMPEILRALNDAFAEMGKDMPGLIEKLPDLIRQIPGAIKEVTSAIKGLADAVRTAYELLTDPVGSFKKRMTPVNQKMMGIETTPENMEYWRKEWKEGYIIDSDTSGRDAKARRDKAIAEGRTPDQADMEPSWYRTKEQLQQDNAKRLADTATAKPFDSANPFTWFAPSNSAIREAQEKLKGKPPTNDRFDWSNLPPQSPLSNPLVHRESYQGANDNDHPLLVRAAYTTQELVDETGKNSSETGKLTAQLEKLNAYFDRVEARAGGRGGGGFQNASYSPDDAGLGSGAPGTGGAGGAGGFQSGSRCRWVLNSRRRRSRSCGDSGRRLRWRR